VKLIKPLPGKRIAWAGVLFLVGLLWSIWLVNEAERRSQLRSRTHFQLLKQQSQKSDSAAMSGGANLQASAGEARSD
jgi:uncharacterized membrane protein